MGEFNVWLFVLMGYLAAGCVFWFAVEVYRRGFGPPLELPDAILMVCIWPFGLLYVLKVWLSRLRKY